MKLFKLKRLLRIGLCTVVSAIFVACNKTGALKKPPAENASLEWNLKTLVVAYQQAGHTNSKWDEPAISALTEFARARSQAVKTNEPWAEIISTNCAAAANAGCDDPMIRYLCIRFCTNETNSATAIAATSCQIATDMQESTYHPLRKVYAATRALEQILNAYGYGAYDTNAAEQALWNETMAPIIPNVVAALHDKSMPAEEAFQMCGEALNQFTGDSSDYRQAYDYIEKPLFENWPDASTTWLLKGKAYIEMAWLARGTGLANEVTQEGWKLFFERLSVADGALRKAWQLNPNDERTAIQMISIAEGRQKDRDEMELWFNRAMAIDPDCYDACAYKLHYLYPQWYGSRDAMITFGRECVASTNWGGSVPLILADAHREYWLYLSDPEEKDNYWKRPDVWPDIEAAFDRFFELNPDATSYYQNYAWYAYKCEQWDLLNELIPKLGPVNYTYFGGKDEFDKMVQLAKKHASLQRLLPEPSTTTKGGNL